ncbi:hypothetical protein Cni_G03832 [Canna indica]|uniref:DNA glycosylase n=1 Tax=Canna indica TaxID=4628 RepID=A0AAQ3Q3E7_9LILI|nr:hypothetical protein Cni_G03832 [Canna indica]
MQDKRQWLSAIDDIFSAFAYDPHNSRSPPVPPTPAPPEASPLTRAVRGRGRRRGRRNDERNRSRGSAEFERKQEEDEKAEKVSDNPPIFPQPMLFKNKRRATMPPSLTSTSSSSSSSSSSSPSSLIRTNVGGKPVVVSRFFPLPPQTSSSPVIPDCKDPIVGKPKAKRRSLPSRCDIEEEKPIDACKQFKKRTRKQPIAQLSAAEKKSDAYRRVPANSTWEPPSSCHHLLQERHSFDQWRVLIICMLLNVTTGRQVGKVLPGLFLLCPDAETTTKVPEEEIENAIQTLGLQKKRARMIKQFSCEYLRNDWTHVTQLHGIGKYAADAYAIFCVGKPEQVVPRDHKLLDYWKFVCGKG